MAEPEATETGEVSKSADEKVRANWAKGRPMLALTMLAGLCGGAFFLGLRTREAPGRSLSVAPEHLALGDVWQDSHFPWVLAVVNRGPTKLEVTGFSTTCTCVSSIRPRSFVLEPGKEQQVHLVLDLTRKTRGNTSGGSSSSTHDIRTFEAVVRPIIKGVLASQDGWTIRGQVFTLLESSVQEIDFAYLMRRAIWPQPTFTVRSAVPLDGLDATLDPSIGRVKLIANGSREFLFQVALNQSLPLGPFEGRLVLRPHYRRNTLPEKVIRLKGFLREEVEAIPSTVLLGIRSVGTVSTERIVLRSFANTSFECTGFQTADTGVTVRPKRENGEVSLDVSVKVTGTGEHTLKTQLSIKTPSAKCFEIPLHILYHGVKRKNEIDSNAR